MAIQEISDPPARLQAALTELRRVASARRGLQSGTPEHLAALERETDLAREVGRLIDAAPRTF